MERQRVARLVCITGLGAGDSEGHGGFVYDRLIRPIVLRTIYDDKNRQEDIIKRSGIDWAIVRPSVLKNAAAKGQVRAFTDLTDFYGGQVSRADVAAFVVDQTGSDEWLRRTPLVTE